MGHLHNLFLVIAVHWSCMRPSLGQTPCMLSQCICLAPVGTFCSSPNQNLNGFGSRLPTVQPGSFAQASFVQTLNLNTNAPLTLQTGSFEGLTNVTALSLTGNQIESLPNGVFSPMTQLISLNLSNNSLTSLNPEAFEGLVHLETLIVQRNLVTGISADLLSRLPSLNTMYLSLNPYNCSDAAIVYLFDLLASPSISVVDGSLVRCLNGTLVMNLNIEVEILSTTMTGTSTDATSNVMQIFPTATTEASTSEIVLMPSNSTAVEFLSTESVFTAATPTPQPTTAASTTTDAATTLPVTDEELLTCPEEVTLTQSGYLAWTVTGLGMRTTATCPYSGGVARRLCQSSGMWSEVIEEKDCFPAPAVQRMLASLTAVELTAGNSKQVSEQLVGVTASNFTLQELNTVTSLAADLVGAGSTNVNVLNNTLQALDNVLQSSGSLLSGQEGGQLATRIRNVIDSLLLDALNINQSVLILSFVHLAVGGAYLPATESMHLIASIRVLSDGSVVIDVGSDSGGDITLDTVGNSTVQVTVYEDDELFHATACGNLSSTNETVRGTVLTPILSVVHRNSSSSESDNEAVTITYSKTSYRLQAMGGERYVCARWNKSVNCGGGGWTTKDCSLLETEAGKYQCQCLHQGIYTLLDILPEDVHPLDISNLPIVTRIIFYILAASTIPFYLTIFITILVNKSLRDVPAAQSLANQCLSQGLTLTILVISFERDEVLGVCYTLGVALQYLYLVSLSWMAVHPAIICVEIFKRLLYEKNWLIWPFVVSCWSWPLVTVVYGGLRYDALTENTTTFNCWLESGLFPSTMTYITAVMALLVLLVIAACNVLLKCSDYDVEVSTYFRLLASYPNALLFIGVILTQYFTAAAAQFNDYILLGTSGCAILCGSYFFLYNGLFLTTVRNAIFCKADPLSRNHIDKYAATHIKGLHFYDDLGGSIDSAPPFNNSETAHKSKPARPNRNGKRGSTQMGYMNEYLTGQTNYGRQIANPVPLSLFGQMQLNGRVRAGGRFSGEIGHNHGFDLATSTDA